MGAGFKDEIEVKATKLQEPPPPKVIDELEASGKLRAGMSAAELRAFAPPATLREAFAGGPSPSKLASFQHSSARLASIRSQFKDMSVLKNVQKNLNVNTGNTLVIQIMNWQWRTKRNVDF